MATLDYRERPFSKTTLTRTGNHVGRNSFPRLFFVENSLRIIINTVLSIQINPNWWNTLISHGLKEKAIQEERKHIERITGRTPVLRAGNRSIHFLLLSELINIARQNIHKFTPVLKGFDEYLIELDSFRGARNYVCHMNYPFKDDRIFMEKIRLKTYNYLKYIEKKYNLIIP